MVDCAPPDVQQGKLSTGIPMAGKCSGRWQALNLLVDRRSADAALLIELAASQSNESLKGTRQPACISRPPSLEAAPYRDSRATTPRAISEGACSGNGN